MPTLDFKEEHVAIVAKWWADQLRSCDPSPNVITTLDPQLAVADMLRIKFMPSEDKVVLFERRLAELLRTSECPNLMRESYTEENWGIEGTRNVRLIVDYHAYGLLLAACRFAKISDMAFPWKTGMQMSYDSAWVKREGIPLEYLYGEPTELSGEPTELSGKPCPSVLG